MPDPVKAAATLPQFGAVIYRHFGHENRTAVAEALRQITFERSQQLLIGDDPDLAIAVGADGVHFRRDPQVAAPRLWRQRCPDWIITMAGLKDGANYRGDLSCLDGLLVSSVFDSDSPTAGVPIGVDGLSRAVERLPVPVFALGGVTAHTAPRLIGSGAAGIAGVSGLL